MNESARQNGLVFARGANGEWRLSDIDPAIFRHFTAFLPTAKKRCTRRRPPID